MGESVFTCYEEPPIALLWYDKALLSEVIVEYFNSHHPDPHDPETGEENNYEGEDYDGVFRFEKQMK